jgi:hypothetical protein
LRHFSGAGDEVFFIDCLEGAERSADDYGFSKLKKSRSKNLIR